jgi:hypothetical protein
MTNKNWKKFRNFMFLSVVCSLLGSEDFLGSLDILGIGTVNCNFFIFDPVYKFVQCK